MNSTGLFLFAYGTLLIPEIMQAVTGQKLPSIDAVLNGYCRYSIKNKVYPAIIAQPDASVSGRLYSDLDQSILGILDDFEDVIYTRCDCEVKPSRDVIVNAQVYVISDLCRHLLSDKSWSIDEFRASHLGKYIKRHNKFFSQYNRTDNP